jgi:poly-gamma-glutamate capsule biosynthesis protein CapA/YwtB (metallophosphatase superfamily)
MNRRRSPRDSFHVVWVGDVLLGSSAWPHLKARGYQWAFRYLRPLVRGDYLVGNAEGPITTHREKFFPEQRFSYRARIATASALSEAGFNAVSLSNNHCYDRGPEGLLDCIDRLTAAGVTPFGAGSEAEAARPLLIDTPHGLVGVVGLVDQRYSHTTASATAPGTIAMSEESIARCKALAVAAGARWVIAYVHWGRNYEPVTAQQRHDAELLARAGYDLVIGAGSHTVQPVEIIDGTPVLYSLGNFTFGTKGRFTEMERGYGLIARLALAANGLLEVELTCIATDNRVIHFQPRLCSDDQAQEVLARLGPDVFIRRSGPLTSWSARMLRRRPVVGRISLAGDASVPHGALDLT